MDHAAGRTRWHSQRRFPRNPFANALRDGLRPSEARLDFLEGVAGHQFGSDIRVAGEQRLAYARDEPPCGLPLGGELLFALGQRRPQRLDVAGGV